ncbi:hypothetical protein [Burkholderia glumae]|uniref:hypothetical protein n=1 Tax=Burkholderia glumae TaxID=337 RepID=UPI002036E50B|nr:hypothetical protein [Burkholderia glumae]MCM2549654.1 hypothetical protein [Burkholderia glumae]MCQ0030662.1 hypothetical protein [Burkholderia glumae]MCQ0038042.1 hypothetical protein [Burkholderia glumae]
MSTVNYKTHALNAVANKEPDTKVARRIYLSYPTFAFRDHPDREFDLKDSIASKFGIDIFSIHFAGSGKTGESYHKTSTFIPGKSDLDTSIISAKLFLKYLEIAAEVTDQFTDRTKFKDHDEFRQFTGYLKKGILIPERMPICQEKLDWTQFFNNLSQNYIDLFDNVNCWIYSTQKIFELKFSKTIELIRA